MAIIRTNLAEWFSSLIFPSPPSNNNNNNDTTSNPSSHSSHDSSHASVELEISRHELNDISRPTIATRSVCLGDSSDASVRIRPSGDDGSSSDEESAMDTAHRRLRKSNSNILELDDNDNPQAARADAIARVGLCIFLPMVFFIAILFLAIRGGYLFGASSVEEEETFP